MTPESEEEAMSQLDEIEARVNRHGIPGGIAVTPSDVSHLLILARKQAAALGRVEGLAARWESANLQFEPEFGPQKMSVGHAVDSIRAAVAAATGGGE